MTTYEYGIIDFELMIRRNVAVIPLDELYENRLLKICLATIFKLARENDFKIPILCWDTKPYFKTSVITEYKSDRIIHSYNDLKDLDKDSKEYKNILKSIKNRELANNVKRYIIENWNHFCINIEYKGLEADDISYMLTQIIDKPSIHISKDSDWSFHNPNENHSVMILKKSGNILYKHNEVLDKDIPLHYQKAIQELFKSSHNGINVKKLKMDSNEIYQKHLSKNLDEDLSTRLDGLNSLSYFNDEIKSFLKNCIKKSYTLNPNVNYLKSYNIVKHLHIDNFVKNLDLDSFENIASII